MVRNLWTIKKSSPVISSVNKLKKRKAVKKVLIFFQLLSLVTFYTKIPHEKLLHVLNEISDFVFKGGTKD